MMFVDIEERQDPFKKDIVDYTIVLNDDTSEKISLVVKDRETAERVKKMLKDNVLWFNIEHL
jgi:hypothetical protein